MPYSTKMTSAERRAVFSLSSILSLRMIGLFMVLPLFTLHAHELRGATSTLVGLAMGIYGLSQAICQIPFGMLSDRLGRKPLIVFGLLLFIAGSVLAGLAHSIGMMIIGRALQGAGAVGSTVLAMVADLTREEQRTKAMAIAGITIGFSFTLAMVLGPVLSQWLSLNTLFFLAALFGIGGLSILYKAVPTPAHTTWHADTEPELKAFYKIFTHPELNKLNSGILLLHAIFTASFVVIPISLVQITHLASHEQWLIYVPALFIAFLISMVCIGIAEGKRLVNFFFRAAIGMLLIAEILLWFTPHNLRWTAISIALFFTAFSLLEAFLPSMISRTAPVARKGTAMGIYSSAQFLGIFFGGVCGGWLYGKLGFAGVYIFCIMLALIWFILASSMQPLRYLVTQTWKVSSTQQAQWELLAAKLSAIPGVVEVSLMAKEQVALLKIERQVMQHPDFIRLKALFEAS